LLSCIGISLAFSQIANKQAFKKTALPNIDPSIGLGASHYNTRSLTEHPYHAILQLKVLGGSFRPEGTFRLG
jgi:hypothetical protein